MHSVCHAIPWHEWLLICTVAVVLVGGGWWVLAQFVKAMY